MSLKRRDFFRIVAGSVLSFPVLGCSTKNYFSPIRKNQWQAGIEEWIESICQACPGGCGIMVRVVDGKAVKIEGNSAHPINRGKLCPIGQSGLQVLYNPDRIKGPLKKVGGRDSTVWAEISWDEGSEIVVSKLKQLSDSGEAHRTLLLTERNRGMSHEILERFMRAYGSPNYVNDDPDRSLTQAFYLSQGIGRLLAYDIENSNCIISFSTNFLTHWPSPVQSMRAYSYLRQGRPGKKAKIIQVEPRFSITASRADKWIAIKPGTEGLLALGIAYVIIKESLYDRNFIEKFTFGFDDWVDARGETHHGYRKLILDEYRSDFVSEATGVTVDGIVTLAKEFAANKPAVAIPDNNVTNYSNGLYNALAIHSLNALVGSIDVPGGVLVKRDVPLQELPKITTNQTAQGGLSQPRIDSSEKDDFPLAASMPSLIPDNILAGKPYPIDLLLLVKSNPLFSSTRSKAYRKAFEKIPYIVSFSSFMDESSQQADLILPDKTYLEKHLYVESSPVSKTPVLGIAKPVINNLYNTRAMEDVILDMAQRLGESVASHFPWKSSSDFVLYKIGKMFQARKGIIFSDYFEETQLTLLEERGWWAPQFSSESEFNQELIKKGGWWDPAYDFGVRSYVFKTPSIKYEFFSQLLAARLAELKTRNLGNNTRADRLDRESLGDDIFMPHYERPQFQGDEKEYPFHLYIHQPFSLSHEYGADQPWSLEAIGFHLNMTWDSWAEINPHDAVESGVSDNDLIWIESAAGKVRTRAKIYLGAMPGVVSIPFGLGHTALGQWARDRGINPLELLETTHDEMTGLSLRYTARIKIYKV